MSRPLFLAVCGPIGVGKSTLALQVAEACGAEYEPERFTENPYLTRFYEHRAQVTTPDGITVEETGITRWGFQAETAFLIQRADQARSIARRLQAGQSVVTDFWWPQNLVFAGITLEATDLATYRALYDRVLADAPVPDLVCVLDADVATLQTRITGRARTMESTVPDAYLAQLRAGYQAWRAQAPDRARVLGLDTTVLDVRDPHARARLHHLIFRHLADTSTPPELGPRRSAGTREAITRLRATHPSGPRHRR